MNRRIFTGEQINELLKNDNISACTESTITYNKDFKLKAVRLYKDGVGSREIFRRAGFDLDIIGKATPKDCLRRWVKTWNEKGEGGLKVETRGGPRPPKPKDLSDADKIKRLEAEIAYLKAENDFLAKLRAKRAE
jgi:transposase-like protein